jgi:hypothetical protein
MMENPGPACLGCVGLGGLEFLPAGDARGGGFGQCTNAQAVVAEGSLLVVVAEVAQAANDKQRLAPMVDKITPCPTKWDGPIRCWPTAAT